MQPSVNIVKILWPPVIITGLPTHGVGGGGRLVTVAGVCRRL